MSNSSSIVSDERNARIRTSLRSVAPEEFEGKRPEYELAPVECDHTTGVMLSEHAGLLICWCQGCGLRGQGYPLPGNTPQSAYTNTHATRAAIASFWATDWDLRWVHWHDDTRQFLGDRNSPEYGKQVCRFVDYWKHRRQAPQWLNRIAPWERQAERKRFTSGLGLGSDIMRKAG